MNRYVALLGLACLLPAMAGCRGEAKVDPAATGSTLGARAPRTVHASKFVIDANESKVSFLMSTPTEKLRGRLAAATSGELFIDPVDLTQTTGTISVDLDKLELFQRVKDEGAEDYASEQKSEKQNEQARDWLQIGAGTAAEDRRKNARAEFKITAITSASQRDVTRMSGTERTIQIKAEGTLLVHGRSKEKVATELRVTFKFEGDKIVSAVIKTKAPLSIALAEFEVKPRDPLGALIEAGLDVLSSKVAKDAPIDLELVLKPDGAPLSTTPPPPDPTPLAPASSASASAAAGPGAPPPPAAPPPAAPPAAPGPR